MIKHPVIVISNELNQDKLTACGAFLKIFLTSRKAEFPILIKGKNNI